MSFINFHFNDYDGHCFGLLKMQEIRWMSSTTTSATLWNPFSWILKILSQNKYDFKLIILKDVFYNYCNYADYSIRRLKNSKIPQISSSIKPVTYDFFKLYFMNLKISLQNEYALELIIVKNCFLNHCDYVVFSCRHIETKAILS